MKNLVKATASKAVAEVLIVMAMLHPAAAQTRRVVVSIPHHKLALIENGAVKKVYPVATGRQCSPSPSGSFRIANRVVNPTYYHSGQVAEPGPRNPVGTRWIGLNEKGYGIHGTNAPGSISKSASHGCIRMGRKDLEEFFEMVRPGDEVVICDERTEETASLFEAPAEPPAATTMASNQSAAHGGQ